MQNNEVNSLCFFEMKIKQFSCLSSTYFRRRTIPLRVQPFFRVYRLYLSLNLILLKTVGLSFRNEKKMNEEIQPARWHNDGVVNSYEEMEWK